MTEKQETIADIIAEKRRRAEVIERDRAEKMKRGEMTSDQYARELVADIRREADRLEAARKREMATAEKSSAVGDRAKIREALEAIISGYEKSDLCDMNYGEWCHDPANICVNVPLCKAIHEARAALAAPPRNCDVGTAEEQAERYMNFCHNYPKCTGCPCVGRIQYHQCEFAWAQLPYEEGGAE